MSVSRAAHCIGQMLAVAAIAFAGSFPIASVPAKSQTAERRFSFNIPSQSIPRGLNAIGRIAGFSVVVNGTVPPSIRGQAVSGQLTAQQALSAFLSGTGLVYNFTNSNTVTVSGTNLGGANSSIATVNGGIALDTIDVSGGGSAPRGSGWEAPPDYIYETPASVASINPGTLTSFGNDLKSAVRSVAGVYSWENAAQPGMAVNIRGMEGMGRVTSTIDGVRQNYRFTGHGPAGYTYVSPSLLAGVDITKGAVTTVGGGGTLAGLVNYRTLSVDDVLRPGEKAGAQITTAFRGNAPGDMSITKSAGMRFDVAGNPNGGSIFGAINLNSADNYEDGRGNLVGNTWREVKSGLIKVSLSPSREHKLDLGGIFYAADFAANFYDQVVANTTLTAKYRYKPESDLIDLRVNGHFNETESEWSGALAYNGRIMTVRGMGLDVSNTSKWTLGDYGLKLDYGFEYHRDEFSGNTTADANPDGVSSLGGTFVQATLSAGMFEFIPGLRYDVYSMKSSGAAGPVPDQYWTIVTLSNGSRRDVLTQPSSFYYNSPTMYQVLGPFPLNVPWRGAFDIDDTQDKFSPKMTVAAKPFDWLQVYGTYEESFRTPTVNEMFFGGSHGAGVTASFVPNPTLRPEEAKGWEFGVNILRRGLFASDDTFRLKAARYQKDVDNYIATKCIASNSMCWFENAAGTSRLKGFEIDASYDIGWAFAAVSYSQSTSDLEFGDGIGGMGEPSRLPDDYMTVTLGARLLDRKLTVGGRVNDVSKGTLIAGGGWETAAYRTYDLFANYQPSERLALFANITNLTNELYMPAMSQDNGPGRRFFGGMTIKLTDGPLFGHGETAFFDDYFADQRQALQSKDWTGFNVGFSGGYTWADAVTADPLQPINRAGTPVVTILPHDTRGYRGWVHAGYDYQFAGGLVLGVEGTAGKGNVKLDDTIVWTGTINNNGVDQRSFIHVGADLEWTASIRGKVGFAVGRYLPYVIAGASYSEYSHSIVFADARNRAVPPPIRHSNTYLGWTVGAGIEHALTESLSIKAEYAFSDLGDKTFAWTRSTSTPAGTWNVPGEYDMKLKQHDFKIGLSYRF